VSLEGSMKVQHNDQERGLVLLPGSTQLGRTPEILSDPQPLRPTETVCVELQSLFDIFNRELFAGELPDCMLTVDIACRAALGYFRPHAFRNARGEVVDQVSLNPEHTISRPMRQVASTVAHELAHQWVHRCLGKRITGYHCKAWGRKMKAIGLMPSNTGQPGGKQTGYQMTHYAIPGGKFMGVVAALEVQGFAITWGRFQQALDAAGKPPVQDDTSKGKVKLACPQCRQVCWGAPTLDLICGKDRCRMLRTLP
jgi:hypothetical protein